MDRDRAKTDSHDISSRLIKENKEKSQQQTLVVARYVWGPVTHVGVQADVETRVIF